MTEYARISPASDGYLRLSDRLALLVGYRAPNGVCRLQLYGDLRLLAGLDEVLLAAAGEALSDCPQVPLACGCALDPETSLRVGSCTLPSVEHDLGSGHRALVCASHGRSLHGAALIEDDLDPVLGDAGGQAPGSDAIAGLSRG